MNFLEAEHIAVLDWPAQSPDLNLLGNVWKILEERAKARNPKTTEELWDTLKEEWRKITKREIEKLILLPAAEDVRASLRLGDFILNI